jgi:hypothetical protein
MDRICRLLEEFAASDEAGDPLPKHARDELATLAEPGWSQRASCTSADPDAWFPEAAWAKPHPHVARICGQCPVRLACLASAIVNDEHGIWGGTRRGQRLHGRARLISGHRTAAVLAELLAMPMPRYEYLVPETAAEVLPVAEHKGRREVEPRHDEWRESA